MTEETQKTEKNWCGRRRGWKIILFPIFGAAAVFLFGTAVMYLWNALIPDIFSGAKAITFWQAIGILVLAKILFGGFRRGCGCGWRGRGRHNYWRNKWMSMSEEEKTKLMNMNPEEKAKFKEEWKSKIKEEWKTKGWC